MDVVAKNLKKQRMSRRMRMALHVACMGRRGMPYKILFGKPEGKRPLRKPRSRREDNIKMDLIEIAWGVMDWIHLSQNRDDWWAIVNTIKNIRFP
jgi:hypothetical protein